MTNDDDWTLMALMGEEIKAAANPPPQVMKHPKGSAYHYSASVSDSQFVLPTVSPI